MDPTSTDRSDDIVVLSALANGIIPADDRDAGAAAVNAGPRLVEKLTTALYRAGATAAAEMARAKFDRAIAELDAVQMQDLLSALREEQAGFFRQLRMDVCGLYLSDPGVWSRIGFPGPSTAEGGYPDFDQSQG